MKLTRIVLASALVVGLGACNGNNSDQNGAAASSTMAAPAATAPAMTPPAASTAATTPPPATTAPMAPPAASTAAPAKSSSGG